MYHHIQLSPHLPVAVPESFGGAFTVRDVPETKNSSSISRVIFVACSCCSTPDHFRYCHKSGARKMSQQPNVELGPIGHTVRARRTDHPPALVGFQPGFWRNMQVKPDCSCSKVLLTRLTTCHSIDSLLHDHQSLTRLSKKYMMLCDSADTISSGWDDIGFLELGKTCVLTTQRICSSKLFKTELYVWVTNAICSHGSRRIRSWTA